MGDKYNYKREISSTKREIINSVSFIFIIGLIIKVLFLLFIVSHQALIIHVILLIIKYFNNCNIVYALIDRL